MRTAQFIVGVVVGLCIGPSSTFSQATHAVQSRVGVGRSVRVPLQYEQPEGGQFVLSYELGRSFDPAKPTVFVIADGQQFYVQAGLIAPLQDEVFGDAFNVVGILGRGMNEAVLREIKHGNSIDWLRAYELLKSDEWIGDIESVRRDLVGSGGTVLLYGRSGGAMLVHQYLAKYPRHVAKVFTQSAVNRFLDAEFNLSSDTFWNEIGNYDKALQSLLLEALSHHPTERSRIMLLLQRQNFFVSADQILLERAKLIHALGDWNQSTIANLSKQYQVNAILETVASDPAASVRIFELFAPAWRLHRKAADNRVDPDFEVGRIVGGPIFRLLDQKRIPSPSMDFAALHSVSADVYLLAGRYDHTADFRSQIALASHYPNHWLLLLNDDHAFLALKTTGLYSKLVQTALANGIHGPEYSEVERGLTQLVYSEY